MSMTVSMQGETTENGGSRRIPKKIKCNRKAPPAPAGFSQKEPRETRRSFLSDISSKNNRHASPVSKRGRSCRIRNQIT